MSGSPAASRSRTGGWRRDIESSRSRFSGRARRCLDLGEGEGFYINWLSLDFLYAGSKVISFSGELDPVGHGIPPTDLGEISLQPSALSFQFLTDS